MWKGMIERRKMHLYCKKTIKLLCCEAHKTLASIRFEDWDKEVGQTTKRRLRGLQIFISCTIIQLKGTIISILLGLLFCLNYRVVRKFQLKLNKKESMVEDIYLSPPTFTFTVTSPSSGLHYHTNAKPLSVSCNMSEKKQW